MSEEKEISKYLEKPKIDWKKLTERERNFFEFTYRKLIRDIQLAIQYEIVPKIKEIDKRTETKLKKIDDLNKFIKEHEKVVVDIWDIGCTPPSSFIYLEQGTLTPISRIVPGDRVIYGGKVKAVRKRWYEGDLFRVKGVGMLPFDVTSEHPIFVSRMSKKYKTATGELHYSIGEKRTFETPTFVPVEKLKERKYGSDGEGMALVIPIQKRTENKKSLSLLPFAKPYGAKVSEGLGHSMEWKLNKRLAWLIGLYVADGSSSGNFSTRTRCLVEFALSKEEHIKKTLEILKEIGYKPTVKKHSNYSIVRTGSCLMARALTEWCGHGAHNKRIPKFIMNHPNDEIVTSFLLGYLAGDGCYQKKEDAWISVTVNKKLALQLQLLQASLGRVTIITKRKNKSHTVNGRMIKGGVIYHCTSYLRKPKRGSGFKITNEYIFSPIRHIERIPYKGWTYNLETERDSYLLSNAIVHNCLPCNLVTPVLEKLSREDNGIIFGRKKLDEKLMKEYKIEAVPTILFFDNGKERKRIRGAAPDEIIEGEAEALKVPEEEFNKRLRITEAIAKAKGWLVNPNPKIRNMLIVGLIKNNGSCPCKPQKINEHLCPCRPSKFFKGAEKEIQETGHCHCGLFFDKKFRGKITEEYVLKHFRESGLIEKSQSLTD